MSEAAAAAPSSAPAAPAGGADTGTSTETQPSGAAKAAAARAADGKFTNASTGTPKPPVEAPPPKRTLKYRGPGGKEVEIDEERAIAELSMSDGYKKKFSELDAEKKKLEQARAKFKEDPDTFLREMGVEDPAEFHASRAWQRIQREQMEANLTPEQKADRRLADGEKRLAEERAQWQAQRDKMAEEQEMRAIAPVFQEHIPKALASVGLPHSGMAVERMTTYLRDAAEAGQPLTPQLIAFAAQSAREETSEALRGIVGNMDGAQIAEFFGKDVADKLRRYDLEQYEAAHAGPKVAAPPPPPPKKDDGYKTEAQMARFHRTGRWD